MMRSLAFLITALLLFQITNSDPGSLILAQTADNGAPAEPSRRMDMTGIDLYMHDYAPTDGKPRKPTLWVHAEEGHAAEDEQVWQVEGVRAVIYGDETENANDLVVEADLGLFNLRENFARLNDDVTLKTGDIKLELDEIEWDNIKKVARSSSTDMPASTLS